MNHQVIVVGAGTAGIPCAIAAAENGAEVLVIEKSAEIGGTLHVTGGHMSGGGTKRQTARGIEDSPAEHIDDIVRISKGSADNEIMRLAVNENPRALDWLADLGFEFDPETPKVIYGHEAYSKPRTVFGKDAGKSILETMRPAWDQLVGDGKIKLLLEHELKDLIFEDGEVVGVRVSGDVPETEIRANAVVLATGGYGSNKEFFNEVTGGSVELVSTTRESSTGDGIIIAREHGAKFHNGENHFVTLGGIENVAESGRCDWWDAWAMIYTSVYRRPREIYVNRDGNRFMNEDEPSADKREHAVMDQPEQKFWLIFDDRSIDDEEPLVRGWDAKTLREKANEGTVIRKADNLGELAERSGIDPKNLLETVKKFNQSADGEADEFGRTHFENKIDTPPFYALLTHGSTLVTFGGLAIDNEMRVLREDGKPINNLYAIGEVLGAGVMNGKAFCSGMLITPAIGLGRLLGKSLGERLG